MTKPHLLKRETKYFIWKESRPLRPARYYFGTEARPHQYYAKSWYLEAKEQQTTQPVPLREFDGSRWWWFREQVYVESEGLDADEVMALALQMQQSKTATIERAKAEMRGEKRAIRSREPLPEAVRHEVWRRDRGRCVDCGSREKLEFDHIIPWSEGGANTVRNLELRCESCNRSKGARI